MLEHVLGEIEAELRGVAAWRVRLNDAVVKVGEAAMHSMGDLLLTNTPYSVHRLRHATSSFLTRRGCFCSWVSCVACNTKALSMVMAVSAPSKTRRPPHFRCQCNTTKSQHSPSGPSLPTSYATSNRRDLGVHGRCITFLTMLQQT